MTHLCINCNAPTVQRSGDAFTCEKCGYTWDVAHEQANAPYLATQGRQPAQAMGEVSQTLDAALGLDQSPVLLTVPLREPQPPTGEVSGTLDTALSLDQPANKPLPEALRTTSNLNDAPLIWDAPVAPSADDIAQLDVVGESVSLREPQPPIGGAEVPGEIEALVDQTPLSLETLTPAELRDLAAASGVDLTGRTRKADIIAALRAYGVQALQDASEAED